MKAIHNPIQLICQRSICVRLPKYSDNQLRRSDGIYCDSCNHGFLSEISVTSFQDYYSNSYRQEYSHKSDVNSTNPAEIYNVYHQYQAQRLIHILPLLSSDYSVLEVGASAGQFLTHIKDIVSVVNAIELMLIVVVISFEHSIDCDSSF